MCQGLVYLKRGGRRPVWLGPYREKDAQGRIPRGWCPVCGMEVFGTGPLCLRCERREANDEEIQPLPAVFPGG